jgi:hypothetical protein
MGLRPGLLRRGDDLKGATRRRANFGLCVARGSANGDQELLFCFSFASTGLTARTTSNGDSGEFGDAPGDRVVVSWMRVGLEGERDNDRLSF